MLEIAPSKIAHVILAARETEEDRAAGRHPRGHASELRAFIADLNEDEQASLTAVMWIGREAFAPEELEEAIATARAEKTTPTEDYLTGEPRLADFLEDGMEALGLAPDDVEDDLLARR